jgi:hypothetical protein
MVHRDDLRNEVIRLPQITRKPSEDSAPGAPGGRSPLRRGPLSWVTGTGTGVAGAVAVAAVLGVGGLIAVRTLAGGHGTPRAAALNAPAAAGLPGGTGLAIGTPRLAAVPHTATMPKPASAKQRGPRSSASPSLGAASQTPSAAGHAPGLAASPPPSPQPSSAGSTSATAPSAPGAGSATCANPQYQTSDPNGMWNLDPYFVMNDAWGISGYKVSQSLYACSYSNWYVVASMDNSNGDGHVKTYPNSHRDFGGEPKITSFSSITSTFAETGPGTGIYEDAYDIWLNGIANSSSTEVMIWTDNHGQTPAGSNQATATIDGRSYAVWKTTGNYIAFVASTNFTSGSMNLKDFFQWLMAKGWIGQNATLGQVDYGAELVSTNGVPATFTFSNFSVNAS